MRSNLRALSLVAAIGIAPLLSGCDLFEGSPPYATPNTDTTFDVPPPTGDVVPIAGDSGCGYDADTDAGPMSLTPAEAGKPNPCPPKSKPAAPTGGGQPMQQYNPAMGGGQS